MSYLFWSLTLISMADQPSSTAAMKSKKKGGGIVKLFRDVIKRPKTVNDSASQSNLTRVSVPSAFGAHDPVPGNDAGSAEPTASGKYIGFHLSVIVNDLASPDGNATLNQGIYCSEFISCRSSGLSHHPDPTAPIQSANPLSSVPDLLGSAVAQGELQYA